MLTLFRRLVRPLLIVHVLVCFAFAGREPAAAQTAVSGELLIGVKPGVSMQASSNALAGSVGTLVKSYPKLNLHRVHVRAGLAMSAAMAALRLQPGVAYVEPNYIRHATSTPNDPDYLVHQYAPALVQADKAWRLWRPKRAITIAIVDTGIDSAHPDLMNKMLRDASGALIGYDALTHTPDVALDDYGHGTHCAGIAAAQINNGVGIAGIAGWNGQAGSQDTAFIHLMPVRALDATGSGNDADIAEGIEWAVDHGAQIVSLSLGGTDTSSTLVKATDDAYKAGAIVVAAAGNDGQSTLNYPAANPNVISVAATDATDTLASYSQFGSWISVAAPGSAIYSTLPTYSTGINSEGYAINYDFLSGTSMATPLVAGEAALLLAQNPSLTNADVRKIILANVDPVTSYSGRRGVHAITGGRVNVLHALQAVNSLAGGGASDFNGDGHADILLQNTQTGAASIWFLNNRNAPIVASLALANNPAWQAVGIGDFNADSNPDILWRNVQTGDLAAWLMQGTAVSGTVTLAPGEPLVWQTTGVADMNGDGKPDILWRNVQTGDVAVWYMDGTTFAGSATVSLGVPLAWDVVGTGDFDGDGSPDILWQNTQTGEVSVWFMNGTTLQQTASVANSVPLVWSVVSVLDLNGDGKPDILWRNAQTGDLALWYMDGTTFAGNATLAAGVPLAWSVVAPR